MSISSIAKSTAIVASTAVMAGITVVGVASSANASSSYSVPQMENIWVQAGGAPSKACIAAAVAMAESGGNPNAYSPTNDRGLWQINGVHGSLSTFSVSGNARAAIAISHNGNNWSPWTTYTQGYYKKYLKDCSSNYAGAPVKSPEPAPTHKTPKTSPKPVNKMPKATVTAPTTVSTDCAMPASLFLQYTVVSGDTLWGIGVKFGVSWESIYNDNKAVIGDNPDLIFPGEKLVIHVYSCSPTNS